MMLNLQEMGCHNINFVTPTHMIYPIVTALIKATEGGLRIPLVYNSGGYDSEEILKLIDGVFDIYMPDFKYFNPEIGFQLSKIKDYPKAAMSGIKEMYRQVGNLKTEKGIAYKGLIIRHLILPENLANTDQIIQWVASLSKETYFNLMDQFHPEYHYWEESKLKGRITYTEYHDWVKYAKAQGLVRLA
jgi:putative pyruvate formate lyase activating enzyme